MILCCVLFLHSCSFGCVVFFFKQKTAYEMRISDWSSDVCSSDLVTAVNPALASAIVAIPGGEAQLTDRAVVEGERLVVQIVRDAAAGKRAVARAGVELAAGPVVLTPGKIGRAHV